MPVGLCLLDLKLQIAKVQNIYRAIAVCSLDKYKVIPEIKTSLVGCY